jgi:hypothetical protein
MSLTLEFDRVHSEMETCTELLRRYASAAIQECNFDDAHILNITTMIIERCMTRHLLHFDGRLDPLDIGYDGVAISIGKVDWVRVFGVIGKPDDLEALADRVRLREGLCECLRSLATLLSPAYTQALVRVTAVDCTDPGGKRTV